MTDIVSKAISKIKNEEATFIIIKEDKIIYQDSGIGVSCIRKLMANQKDLLKEAYVVDKVIGKAASMLLISCGVSHVHGLLMSESAVNILTQYHTEYSYDCLVPYILNRKEDGLCPLENCVKDTDDLVVAQQNIEKTIKQLMANK
ncbi:MAG: DUF1893 domain-containing protein [Erysipelotrichaceae bacterium]